jgi:hypothetical protein
MSFDNNTLSHKAKVTADLLIQAVLESELIENIWSSYEKACVEMLARFDVQPREIDQDDLKRLLFEVLCFSAFLIMGQEICKFIVQRRPLLESNPNSEGIRYYNGKLLERLKEYFEAQKFGAIREVIATAITPDIQFGLGESLDATKRISDYVQSGSSLKGAELFAHYVAFAIGPQHGVVLKPIWMAYVESIVDLVRLVLKAVFEERKTDGVN